MLSKKISLYLAIIFSVGSAWLFSQGGYTPPSGGGGMNPPVPSGSYVCNQTGKSAPATVANCTQGTGVPAALKAGVSGSGLICLATGSACSGGGGSTYPFTFVQESSGYSPTVTTSFTYTFPNAAASSGNTLFLVCSGDGSQATTFPMGWTVDVNQAQATYARVFVIHKTSASDTSATFTTVSGALYACYFFEIIGSHTLDQSSSAGGGNADTVTFPAITPTANAVVFAVAGYAMNGTLSASPSLNPAWRVITTGPLSSAGFRVLAGWASIVAATHTATLPPQLNLNDSGLLSGSGIAWATFSIL